MKTRYKSERLLPCYKPLKNLMAFLKELKLGAAPSLRMVWLKTVYIVNQQEFATSSKAFQAMLDDDLVGLLSAGVAPDDDGATPSLESL